MVHPRAFWERHRYDIVFTTNMHKSAQDTDLRQALVATGQQHLAEANPHDLIWGIGYKVDHPLACDPPRWHGRNLLGRTLMDIHRHFGYNPPSGFRPWPQTAALSAPPEPASTLSLIHI